MIYDISRTLSPSIAVWPGDPAFEIDWTQRITERDPANVGRLSMSIHTGTHVDAPYHFLEDGRTIDEVPLAVWMGDAVVVDAGEADVLGAEHVPRDVPPRVLFKTRHSAQPDDQWNPRFPHVDPDVAGVLSSAAVVLLGTDAPSVDPLESESLPAHRALASHGIVILENLQLSAVPPGRYELIALPLKLKGMDGSPVRAVLIG